MIPRALRMRSSSPMLAAFDATLSLSQLHALDALAKREPLAVHPLRQYASRVVIPAVRRMAPRARAPLLSVLQHWLEIGLIRTPVALPGTGYFAALQARLQVLAAETAAAAAAASAPRYVPDACLSTDDRVCALCDGSCAVVFDDAANSWMYVDAVKIKGGNELVHVRCLEDEDDSDAAGLDAS